MDLLHISVIVFIDQMSLLIRCLCNSSDVLIISFIDKMNYNGAL